MTGRDDDPPLPPDVQRRIAVALDGAQAALTAIRAMPPGRARGIAARQLAEDLRQLADRDVTGVLHEEVLRQWTEKGAGLRPLGREFGISTALVQKITAGTAPGVPAPAEEEEGPAPVAVAVVTSHLGVLTGIEGGGALPRLSFIRADVNPGETPGAAAVLAVGKVTGLAVRAGRELARSPAGQRGPATIWVACRPATSDTEIGGIDSPVLADVQWMSFSDVLRRMRGSLPAAVTEHLTRVLEG